MKKKQSKKNKNGVIRQAKWRGQLEGQIQGCLYGWALNTDDFTQRVSLEICLDQQVIGLVSANLQHSGLPPDLKDLLQKNNADPCHGFIAEIGKLHVNANYTVRVANTHNYLHGCICIDDQVEETGNYLNLVYSDGGLRLLGYAMTSQNQGAYDTVYAYLETELLAKVDANLNLPNLRGQLLDGYGFRLDLPLKLADGQVHQITVLNSQGKELNGSPIQVCCLSQGLQSILPETASALCKRMVSRYEALLPRSLATSYYKEWREQFGLVGHSAELRPSPLRLAVCFDSDADADAVALSRESLHALQQALSIEIVELFPEQGHRFSQAHVAEFSQTNFSLYLRAGDTIIAQNLQHMLAQISNSQALMSYGDAEYLGQAWFKPAWNLEYALASDYFLSGVLCRTEFLLKIIASKPELIHPAAWYWAAALALDKQSQNLILHFPYVVYRLQKPISDQESLSLRLQLNQMLETESSGTQLEQLKLKNCPQLIPLRKLCRNSQLDKNLKVCLIIPTRDQCELLQRCIESIQEFTSWPDLEIIVVDNNSTQVETKAYFAALKSKGISVLHKPGPFNFSQLNNDAVIQTDADIIGLINNDIEAIHHGWLEEMLSHFSDQRVAMVGAKLLWPNGMVQHGGVIIGTGGLAAHYGNLLHDDDAGDFGRNQVTQQLSAVTAACLLVRKSDWQRVGGLNPIDFPVAFNDVDLCLKLRALGRHIIWTPFARLLHLESASRGKEDSPEKQARAQREMTNLRRRWGASLLYDPSYHPGLNLDAHAQVYNGFAIPPRYRYVRSNQLQQIPETSLAELGIRSKPHED